MLSRVPPVWLVVVGIASVQLGAGIAKTVFDDAAPLTLVWLRLATSALVLGALVRPTLRGRTQDDWRVAIAFGVVLGTMNWAIYESFARIPLGIAVTIEFLGPLGLAVVGSRRPRDLVWVALAAIGVGLLGIGRGDLNVAGVAFALLAAAAWTAYILLSASTGRRWPGLDGLTVASVVATVMMAPFLVAFSGRGLDDPHVVALGALVGLLSSVIPYSCEITALRTIRPSVFGILMSIEPAAAALAGMLVVGEFLTPVQWLAIGCVIAASIGATRSESRLATPALD
ncbi:EamA family transporter [Nocardioides sp.]|uniref:EamA family transporter n=1 Tax=Nocardioides sp. TaxID=35761 RepID=UPI002F423EFF